jgi:hypothetical protein
MNSPYLFNSKRKMEDLGSILHHFKCFRRMTTKMMEVLPIIADALGDGNTTDGEHFPLPLPC